MFAENTLTFPFLISFALHALFLMQGTNFSAQKIIKEKKQPKFQMHYLRQNKQHKGPPAQRAIGDLDPFLKLPTKITARETSLATEAPRDDIFQNVKASAIPSPTFTKPAFIKPEYIAVKTKISLSPSEAERNDSPAYISHSQIVREKIKRSLYQNYNRTETGQVYLTFLLSKNGFLKTVQFSEEKSTASGYLREIALQSIRDAAPFPNFPKGLDYDELSFNVVISFELE
ncbi:MAG: energy transducer TonB [Candidatus Omnitrophica bacterium]|nr:energy transducer TonB [Candidatus Omnitrophota bacterium]